MNKSMIAALLMAALPAGVLAPSVLAQSADTTYCKALSATYDRYVTNPNMGRGNQRLTASIGQAQAQCAGNPAAGIPVLEKALKDARIDLPPRS